MATTYTIPGYANGLAVKTALDLAGTSLQPEDIGTDSDQVAAGNHAHSGASVSLTPISGLSATDVQSGFEELATLSSLEILVHDICGGI